MLGSARSGTRVGLHNGLRLGYHLEFGTRRRAFRPFAVLKFPRKIEPRFLQTEGKVETKVDKNRSRFLIYREKKKRIGKRCFGCF